MVEKLKNIKKQEQSIPISTSFEILHCNFETILQKKPHSKILILVNLQTRLYV